MYASRSNFGGSDKRLSSLTVRITDSRTALTFHNNLSMLASVCKVLGLCHACHGESCGEIVRTVLIRTEDGLYWITNEESCLGGLIGLH